MENANFTPATLAEVAEALKGKTIKRVETTPAVGQDGFTIVCKGTGDADGTAVSICNISPSGASFYIHTV